MTAEALELEIERAWIALADRPAPRTCWLMPDHRIVFGNGTPYQGREIGTYTRTVLLADFRADVFHVYECQRGRHG